MVDLDRLRAALVTARCDLLAEREPAGHWVGRLASSPLSTATAVAALSLFERHAAASSNSPDRAALDCIPTLVLRGLDYLASTQNADGGWGDTDKSLSNIATTMLARSAFALTAVPASSNGLLDRADAYISRAGGIAGVRRRFGSDRTFAAPILALGALAGLVNWRDVPALPFELAALPPAWWRRVRLPVVSYAIPALVAIGQLRHHFHKPLNPIARLVRRATAARTLDVLLSQQPASGGYLEATPLTSFVVMSLAAMDRTDHPVARRGAEFLVASARGDGSWPIDSNLATWNTTLAINALAAGDELPDRPPLNWLLSCQHRETHPFTYSPPGGWAWTDRSGGVPDADDTAGALLALSHLRRQPCGGDGLHVVSAADDRPSARSRIDEAAHNGTRWLLDLQNSNGGWPTFCRGWGTLPFDRSGADLTAHALRALAAWRPTVEESLAVRIDAATRLGIEFLAKTQRPDGSWLPLWFGNQYEPDEGNPVYGTAKVVLAFAELALGDHPAARRGLDWLVGAQNPDAGWGGGPWRSRATAEPPQNGRSNNGKPGPSCRPTMPSSSVEETALAVEALEAASRSAAHEAARDRGLPWLLDAVAANRHLETSPIGFYFAKLWYYERLYPLVFTAAALGRAARRLLPPSPAPAAVGGVQQNA